MAGKYHPYSFHKNTQEMQQNKLQTESTGYRH